MMGTVLISGDGIAASCCAQSLTRSKVDVLVARAAHARSTYILLSESSQTLLVDLFDEPNLFCDMPRIRKRVVSWGTGSDPIVLPHSSVVVWEPALLESLWQKIQMTGPDELSSQPWEIRSSNSSHPGIELLRFGSQFATSSNVQLKPEAERDTCWIESVEDGWLFLFTAGEDGAHLISVGDCVERLLDRSRLIAAQVDSISVSARMLPAHPRILSAVCGSGWLACGSAAMGFDPLCGEGAGNAVREAILASAVIRAISRGFDPESLLANYSARLTLGFLRHLLMCYRFYRTGGTGIFWETEVTLLQQGIEWCQRELSTAPPPAYRLVDFDLVAL